MDIPGLNEEQIAASCEMWNLGTPIDVMRFFDRYDIPDVVKGRVRERAERDGIGHPDAEKHRLLQAAIIIEVAALDPQKWNPIG
jgi:hypothetical protein